MEGHTFTGWPIMTILRGEVTAEWADDSPGMRPVGDPRGEYLPRSLKTKSPSPEITSMARIAQNRRWLREDWNRPGFCAETQKYTGPREG